MPSGNTKVRFSPLPVQRQPTASRGRLESCRSGTGIIPGEKSSRRGTCGIDVGVVQRIKLCPKNVAFVSQRPNSRFLQYTIMSVAGNERKGEICISWSLVQTRLEVSQSG